jgi:hypothetical protein
VTDQPPAIDTSTGTLSQVSDEQRVNDLPLNGCNAAALTALVPGVVTAPSAAPTKVRPDLSGGRRGDH